MTSQVYRLHSTLELPLETVHEYFESNPELPDGIDSVDITRRNNTLIVSAVAADDSISKYTPTAQLKASVTETRVLEEDESTRIAEVQRGANSNWSDDEDEEEEIATVLIEIAAFKGDRETVLQNSALQYEMFQVLCELARRADKGTLTAISERDGELHATRIVDGEDRAATVEVVEGPGNEASSNGVNWQDNKYIS